MTPFFYVCDCCQYCSFSYFRALHCIPITPISVETVLKVLELLPLESVSIILEYMIALQQQKKSKKMRHLMSSVEKFANVTCMLDDNQVVYIV